MACRGGDKHYPLQITIIILLYPDPARARVWIIMVVHAQFPLIQLIQLSVAVVGLENQACGRGGPACLRGRGNITGSEERRVGKECRL